ncbi:glycosyltransferase family 4 protein [bacterium]|nr:glycosyltransferase family 4 protein [bacterium]
MRKILILTDQFPPRQGGVSIWMEKLALLLGVSNEVIVADLSESVEGRGRDARGPTAEIYAGCSYRSIQETVRTAERATVPPRKGGFTSVLKLFLLMRPEELAKLFFVLRLIRARRLGPRDWVIVSDPAPMGYSAVFARFLLGIPFAAVCHGGEVLYHRSRRIESVKLSAVLKEADILIANSRFTQRLLVDAGCEPDNIRVVHPGVDVRHFRPGPKDLRLIRELGIKNRTVLLTVAHLVEHKNHSGVLAVMAALIGKYRNLHYLIMGNGPTGERIKTEARRLGLEGRVTFLRQVSYADLPRYYRLCDVYIMLSRQMALSVEGFGIAFLEAGACGKPSIGMAAGGIADAVEHGRSGFLVRDIQDAVEKTDRLLADGDLRRRMGRFARRRCEGRFTWDDCIRRVEEGLIPEQPSGR